MTRRLHPHLLGFAAPLLPVFGCAEKYPIAPTLCDEWCNIQNPRHCEFPFHPFEPRDQQTPADCVAQCENAVGTYENSKVPQVSGSKCAPLFADYMECVKGVVATDNCGYSVDNSGLTNPEDAGLAGYAGVGLVPYETCFCEWQKLDQCKPCATVDCTPCKRFCGLTESSCSMYKVGCLSECVTTMPADPRCLPALGNYIGCRYRTPTLTGTDSDAGVASSTCEVEIQLLSQCRACSEGHDQFACPP